LPKYILSYKPFGKKAILIEWPSEINAEILKDIVSFKDRIEQEVNLQDIVVGYNSLLLVSTFEIEEVQEKILFLKEWYTQLIERIQPEINHWEIPVCYDASFGVDLGLISKEKNLSAEEIVHLHTNTIYTVFFIGFLPGFLYLGGLNSRLNMPRKNTPRLQVSKGSVAIGGEQTGVYPTSSSGGWNIIGNSPVSFFDLKKEAPCFAKTGDKITFKSVSLSEYRELEKAIKTNNYQIKTIS